MWSSVPFILGLTLYVVALDPCDVGAHSRLAGFLLQFYSHMVKLVEKTF